MEDRKTQLLKEKVRQYLESYMKQNNIKFTKRPLSELTQQVLNAQKKEVQQKILTKQEQIKALNDEITQLKQKQAELSSQKPDETTL